MAESITFSLDKLTGLFKTIEHLDIFKKREMTEQIRQEIQFMSCSYKALKKLSDKISHESSVILSMDFSHIRENINKTIERANALFMNI